ncbi:MAG: polyprenyl synthetase family protein [Candidatus Daviesbacteria bacterium]|nr:polyprenyl synthetase family protein [Candidatus Daviesbacteria bacterium]
MSNFVDYLIKYNKDLKPIIDATFDKEQIAVGKIVPMAGDMINDYKKFLSGGKKLRGCEIFLGYQMFAGMNKEEGLLASLTIEIIHSFLLMHDDVMDQDDLRRGEPTIHKKYAKHFGDHYGESMAITLGDEGMFWAYRILNSLHFSRANMSKASEFLSQVLLEVGIGQALDITYEEQHKFSEEAVLQIHRYKTAEYTISGPLSVGAILAGADEKKLKAIKDFGIPVGIAFQIRDDELGMFSTEEELGKPVDSDLKEGKVTLLIVKALEFASVEDKKFLQSAHGNQKLTKEEVERVRTIIINSGAFAYSQKAARDLVEEGKKFIPEITDNIVYQKLLVQLADFVIERQS